MFVGLPSAFSITRGVVPSITQTAELVVPKSIPMTGPCTLPSVESVELVELVELYRAKEGTAVRPTLSLGRNVRGVVRSCLDKYRSDPGLDNRRSVGTYSLGDSWGNHYVYALGFRV